MVAKKPPLPPAVRAFFQAAGREGGKLGGARRWKGVSAAKRSAFAKRAVAAREAKRAAKAKKAGR